jgi:4-hydroxythreonine-4-phosphate dehydrogenase
MQRKRPIAITMGDPAGIGPEVIVRAWLTSSMEEIGPKVVYGNMEVMREAASRFAPQLRVLPMQSANADPDPARDTPEVLRCVETSLGAEIAIFPGEKSPEVSAFTGKASYLAIERAAHDVLAGLCRGMVTLPISKWAWHQAGYRIPGHTELLAELCEVADSSMMLYLRTPHHPAGFGVVHATLHMSVRQALDTLSTNLIVDSGRRLQQMMQTFFNHYNVTRQPRLGVCAVNPHAGEQGLFGDEEGKVVLPAVRALARDRCDALGPLPADSLFARGAKGEFDGVVAMYHDQGHIAIKLLTMFDAVNITLGLPIVRTSVAHGTATDIAWKGIGRIEGFLRAIEACDIIASLPRATRAPSGDPTTSS